MLTVISISIRLVPDGECGCSTHLVRGVIDHEVHDEAHPVPVHLILECVPVLEGAVARIGLLVVGNVVTL